MELRKFMLHLLLAGYGIAFIETLMCIELSLK
jgi:hypothetical protein